MKKWKTAHDSLHHIHVICCSYGSRECSSNRILISSAVFAWHQCDKHTDRHTDHASQINKKSQIIGKEAASPSLPLHCTAHPHKNAPPVGKLVPHLLRRTLGVTDAPPRMASRSTQLFLQNTRSLPMDRQTDRQYGHETQPVPIAAAIALPSTLSRG